jgi:hypothetical protein
MKQERPPQGATRALKEGYNSRKRVRIGAVTIRVKRIRSLPIRGINQVVQSTAFWKNLMPNKKAKAQARAQNRVRARKADLAARRAKLVASAGPTVPELPRASVRQRKALKNRIRL